LKPAEPKGPALEVLHYEKLVADFENKLVTQLRSFGADQDYLEMWVPDHDPVLGILNMAEAAQAFGKDAIAVRVNATTLPETQMARLLAMLDEIGTVECKPEADASVLIVTGIGSKA
jgi:hypothetical protein